MKNLKHVIVFALVAMCAFTACKDDKKAAAALAAAASRTADSLAAVEAADMEAKRAEEAAAAAAATADADAKVAKNAVKKPAVVAKPAVKPAAKPAPKAKPKAKTPTAPPADINTQGEATMLGGGDKQLGDASSVVKRPGRDNVLTFSEVKPAYPGGDKAMMAFLNKTIKYPTQAKDDGIKGTVYVKFVVEKDGVVDDIVISKGVHPLLDAEAMRVVKAMPRWAPGRQSGQLVATQYTLPVKFQLVD